MFPYYFMYGKSLTHKTTTKILLRQTYSIIPVYFLGTTEERAWIANFERRKNRGDTSKIF
jgi:hypothetical protein